MSKRRDPKRDAAPDVAPPPFSRLVDFTRVGGRAEPIPVEASASETERAAIAAEFGLLQLDRLTLIGAFEPWRKDGWRLNARLSATATQACVVSLDPVPAEVEIEIERRFTPDAEALVDVVVGDPALDDGAAPEVEPLLDVLDVGVLVLEELALALDPYPRADGHDFEPAKAAPPGVDPDAPIRENPFAALASLRNGAEEDEDAGK